jgi:hypothetical protein
VPDRTHDDARRSDPRGRELRALVAALLPIAAGPLAACGTCPEQTTVIPITAEEYESLASRYGIEALPLEDCDRLCGLDDGGGSGGSGGAGTGGSGAATTSSSSDGFQSVRECSLVTIEFSEPAVLCTGASLCGGVGRRPPGLVPSARPVVHGAVGAYFAEMARLESASVPAFVQLERELSAFGAPRELVARARSAARDEARHARVCRALARRFGAEAPRAVVRRTPLRSLARVAIDNTREGCVGESFGALALAVAAGRARDPAVRSALARIALDEAEHAALSFDVDAWLTPQLTPGQRSAALRAKRAGLARLTTESARGAPAELRSVAGLLAPSESRALVRQVSTLCDA